MSPTGSQESSVAESMETLGLPRYATEAEARKAYKDLVRRVHPDKGGDPRRFQEIQRAYELLAIRWERDRSDRRRIQERLSLRQQREALADPLQKHDAEVEPTIHGEELRELRFGEDLNGIVPSIDLKNLADEQYNSGNFEKALWYYDAAASYAKIDNLLEYAELYEARSRTHYQLGSYICAVEDATRCTILRPIWAPGFRAAALAQEKLELWVAAQKSYSQLLASARQEEIQKEARAGLRRVETAIADENCTAVLRGHTSAVDHVAFQPKHLYLNSNLKPLSRSYHLLATSSRDGTVRIWQAPSGNSVAVIKGDSGPVTAMAWSSNGSDVVAIGYDQGLCTIWALEAKYDKSQDTVQGLATCLHKIQAHSAELTHLAYDKYGSMIATASKDLSCRVWDSDTGQIIVDFPVLHKDRINRVAFSPLGRTMATASDDQDARVWDIFGDIVDPGSCIHTLGWESGRVNDIAYTCDGRLIVIATHEDSPNKRWYRLLVWSAVTGRICKWYDGHESVITCMSWHPCPSENDDYMLVTSSQDGTLRFWPIAGEPAGAGQCMVEVDEHRGEFLYQPGISCILFEGALNAVQYNPNGMLIASGSHDHRVRLYGAESTECLAEWAGHTAPVRGVSWSNDGLFLASCSDDGTGRVWKVNADISLEK